MSTSTLSIHHPKVMVHRLHGWFDYRLRNDITVAGCTPYVACWRDPIVVRPVLSWLVTIVQLSSIRESRVQILSVILELFVVFQLRPLNDVVVNNSVVIGSQINI